MKPPRRVHAALIALAALTLACLGLGKAWVEGLRPDPGPDAPRAEAPRARITRTDAEGPGFLVSGHVRTLSGEPAPGVSVRGTRTKGAVTDQDGRFELSLVQPESNVSLVGTSSTPFTHRASERRDDLDFVVPEHCPLRVEVVDDRGEPVPQARLELSVFSPPGFPYPGSSSAVTDPLGAWEPAYHPCGSLTISAEKPPLGSIKQRHEIREASTLRLVLEPGVRVFGVVRDHLGAPVEGGRVTAERHVDAAIQDGDYELWLAPGAWELRASAWEAELLSERHTVTLEPDQGELELDFELRRQHLVEVRCKGLPEDSCANVLPVMCTHRLSPIGEECNAWDPVQCLCPLGQTAVRGGGRSVAVEPGDELVWLDFTSGGGLDALVLRDGAELDCLYGLYRVPDASLDLASGAPARYGDCLDGGRIEERGLQPGRWVFELYEGSGRWPQDDVFIQEGQVLDLGVIDLGVGGSMVVLVLDGLTGEPAHWEPVLVQERGRASVNPLGAGGMSSPKGLVEVTGLGPGTYEVFLPARPLERITVELAEDEEVQVELKTSEAAVLEEQGFALDREGGDLVISEVDPEGLAAEAGLRSGDVVVGVVVMGVDVLDWMPSRADQVAEWVLRSYAGPGVELVVERDDELLDVGI